MQKILPIIDYHNHLPVKEIADEIKNLIILLRFGYMEIITNGGQ